MPTSLDRLPFDVLFNISDTLEFNDIIQLCHTCRQLNLLLAESSLCWKMIRDHAPHSKEALLARDGQLTYGEAVRSLYGRRHAFARAVPFSARSLGKAHTFIYRQGVLCVLNGNMIEVSDIHHSKEPVRFDIFSIIRPFDKVSSSDTQLNLLYYADNLLAIHQEGKVRGTGRIWLVSTEPGLSEEQRLRRRIVLGSAHKLFARHTSTFLYFGTYTAISESSGHHEWEIRGVSLDPTLPINTSCTKPLQLEEFFGYDVGSTVAFEIHNGYFYAVSNQTTFDVEEVDWTSFYHVIRFPIETPIIEAMEIRDNVYRRQHREGPIHDSWTDLSIQYDEKTNRPIIVEARKEWQNGSSKQSRTFYMSKIHFNSDASRSPSLEPEEFGTRNNGKEEPNLPDDRLVMTLESHDRPNYMPEIPRKTWQVHPEFGPHCTNTRGFVLSRTKFRGYNYSAKAFIDLVEDDRCCPTSSTPCIRLRVGARQPAPLKSINPLIELSSLKGKEKEIEQDDGNTKKQDEYRHSEIAMWPPSSIACPCAAQLHNIMNPVSEGSSSVRTITGVMDERSLVYMVKNGRGYGYGGDEGNAAGDLVLVSFDRHIKTPTPSRCGSRKRSEEMDVDIEDERTEFETPNEWRWLTGQHGECQ